MNSAAPTACSFGLDNSGAGSCSPTGTATTITGNRLKAVSFTTSAGPATSVQQLRIPLNVAAGTFTIRVSLTTLSGGNPILPALASADFVLSFPPATSGWQTLDLSAAGFTMQPSTGYAIVLSNPGVADWGWASCAAMAVPTGPGFSNTAFLQSPNSVNW